jgi:hypothetical protein
MKRRRRSRSRAMSLKGLGSSLGADLEITSTNFLAGLVAGGALTWFFLNNNISASVNSGY